MTIAIIGQGYMGQTHAQAWSELGLGDQIAYVCTPRPGAPLPGAPLARFVTELDIVLADPNVHILSVCTPTRTHADIAVRALAAGKNVLLEKPLALTLADGETIAAAATRSTGVLMVAQVVRFFPGYRMLRESVQAGEIGAPRAVRARRLSAAPTWAQWLADDAQSGGMLVDFAIHDFDQLNLFLGTPATVRAVRAGTDGLVETTVEYVDGGIGQMLSCADMPPDFAFTSSIEVVGTRGIHEHQPGVGARAATVAAENPYANQAAYFLECVRHGTEPTLCSTNSAILALRLSLAARESLATGTVVSLI